MSEPARSPRLLVLLPVSPYPPESGGDIRAFHLLRRLSRTFEVHLLSAWGEPDHRLIAETGIAGSYFPDRHGSEESAPRISLARRIMNKIDFWRGAPHGLSLDVDPSVADAVRRLVSQIRFDAVLVDHLFMMQYSRYVGPSPVFFSATDVETTKFMRWFDDRERPRLRRRVLHWAQQQVIRFHESRVGRNAQVVFATSHVDREVLERMNRCGRFVVAANGVDLSYFQPRSRGSFNGPPAILFVGTLSYKPNHRAVVFLVNEVFPLVRRDVPAATCHLVGKTEDDDYAYLHRPDTGVYMHGRVPDIRPYIERCQILVVPLFIGSGTRIKIVEAMASATPVVSTAIGAEGITYHHGEDILIANTAEEIAGAVVSLLKDRERAAAIGAAGRRLVEREYTWDVSAEVVRQEITRAIGADRVTVP